MDYRICLKCALFQLHSSLSEHYQLQVITIDNLCVTGDAEKIIHHALYGPAQNQSYNRLAEFTDTLIGSRIAGSKNLEHAIGKFMLRIVIL
jgi:hypothetical protein